MTFPPVPEQRYSSCRCCRRAPELGAAGMMPLCSAASWCGEWVAREVGE